VLRCIEQRLTLATADPYGPMDVYVSVGSESGLAMITQRVGGEVRVIALVSRSLTSFEKKRTGLEQRLYIAGWALHRCRRFTTTSPAIRVHLPEPESVVVMRDKSHHLRLEALLVDLKCY
jgi:RNase H-like domain found in reverse transcriptase